MGSKIQGEGDYESACHYNDETRKFGDEHARGGKQIKGSAKKAPELSRCALISPLEMRTPGSV
jgi:hypothetical protein